MFKTCSECCLPRKPSRTETETRGLVGREEHIGDEMKPLWQKIRGGKTFKKIDSNFSLSQNLRRMFSLVIKQGTDMWYFYCLQSALPHIQALRWVFLPSPFCNREIETQRGRTSQTVQPVSGVDGTEPSSRTWVPAPQGHVWVCQGCCDRIP